MQAEEVAPVQVAQAASQVVHLGVGVANLYSFELQSVTQDVFEDSK